MEVTEARDSDASKIEAYIPLPDDPRYSRPIEYPKDTMDNDALLKKAKKNGPGTPGTMNKLSGSTPGRFGGF